jgi:UDP-glucuronate 4-epimerase
MKILITGSAGFVGSHLTSYFLQHGSKVVALDNFNDFYSPEYKKLRFNELVDRKFGKNLAMENIDLTDMGRVETIFAREKPDIVIHLAGQPGVRLPTSDNYKYINSNIIAFSNVFNSALKWKSRAFMYASSSSVYGNSLDFPLKESSTNLRPISFYGSTKLINEIWAKSNANSSDTRILGMRFFSVYGPWGRPDMAYFKIACSLYSNTSFKMFGDGSHIRDMTHIEDVVKSIDLLSKKVSEQTSKIPSVVNIGGGRPHSLSDLISALEKNSGKSLVIDKFPASDLDVLRTEASFEVLNTLIQYTPRIDLEEGAKSLVDWITTSGVIEKIKKW